MTIERIYDQTVGQLAGVRVVSAGKGEIKRDGTEAFAQAVTNVNSAGDSVDLATEATQLDVLAELQTVPTSIPHFATDTTSDLTYGFSSSSSSGEVSLVTATASQTTRVYKAVVTAAAATVIEIRDGAAGTALWTIEFPAAGAYVFDFDPRPWAKTTANTALIRNSTVATKVTIAFWYIKSA
jgi:hypothetical protein